MRLFIALPFDPPAPWAFLSLQNTLRRRAVKGNFAAGENFHLTLAFLGGVAEDRLDAALAALDRAPVPPVDLVFDSIRAFHGGIWHLDPAPCDTLFQHQYSLSHALRRAGFSLEDRPYVPHLTLGRKIVLQDGFDPSGPLDRPIAAHSPGGRLFLSHRVDGALKYTPLG